MRSMAITIHRVRVRNWAIASGIVITNKISTKRYKAPLTETPAQSRMLIVNTCVKHSHLDALSGDALGAELFNLRHDMRREGCFGVVVALLQAAGRGGGLTGPLELALWDFVELDGPDVFDGGFRGDFKGFCFGVFDVI